MTSFNANEIALSISDEFFQVDDDVLVTLRGMSRLTGVNHSSISRYMTRSGMVGRSHPKGLKSKSGKDFVMVGQNDFISVCQYFMLHSVDISDTTRKQVQTLVLTFASRGYLAWVNDVLGMKVDATAANAEINELVGLYPGLKSLTTQQTDTMQAYISCRQYLTEVRGLSESTAQFKWMMRRLPMMGSQSFQSLKQEMPQERLVILPNGHLGLMKTYLYSELPVLDMAYEKLLTAFNEYQKFLSLDWV